MPAADLKRRALIGALKYDIIGWIAVFFLKSSETDNVLIREGVFLAGLEPDLSGKDGLVSPLEQHELSRPFYTLYGYRWKHPAPEALAGISQGEKRLPGQPYLSGICRCRHARAVVDSIAGNLDTVGQN